MGGPKALVELDGEPLVRRALRVLADGGCAPRVVVVGAAADAVRAVLPRDVTAVEATDWAEGMGASLRAGFAALPDVDAVLVHLVDLPGVTAAAVARLAEARARQPCAARPTTAARLTPWCWVATIGRRSRRVATGDAGARDYLEGQPGAGAGGMRRRRRPRRRRHPGRASPLAR